MENIRRPDFTHALIHLTRERFESSDDFLIKPVRIGPFDVLKQMLTDRKVRAGSGLVKQSYKVVCLSECPLSSIHHLTIDISRYRPYGIAISKSAVRTFGYLRVDALRSQEGRDAIRALETHPPARPPATSRTGRRPVRVHACGHCPEPPPPRQADSPSTG